MRIENFDERIMMIFNREVQVAKGSWIIAKIEKRRQVMLINNQFKFVYLFKESKWNETQNSQEIKDIYKYYYCEEILIDIVKENVRFIHNGSRGIRKMFPKCHGWKMKFETQ